ncbi:MAG TPA: CopG family transcriptional regulator [Candidatus Omnitrophota bacterium]|nr:CopG family transcriptional regulator [Candidatus Omnitrophota bacterium]
MKKNKNIIREKDSGYKADDLSDPDFPVGKLTRVPDFLPPPEELFPPKSNMVKVTIVLRKESVDFFKEQARKHHTKYQRMIRRVIDHYAVRYQGK